MEHTYFLSRREGKSALPSREPGFYFHLLDYEDE